MKQGYVFINENGEFAREIKYASFGERVEVGWSSSVNDATVFHLERPWLARGMGSALAALADLKNCQRVEATSKTVVTLEKWSKQNDL